MKLNELADRSKGIDTGIRKPNCPRDSPISSARTVGSRFRPVWKEKTDTQLVERPGVAVKEKRR